MQSAQIESVNNVQIFEPAKEPDPITFNRRYQEDNYRNWVAKHRNDGLIVVKDGSKWRVHHAYCPYITGPINQGKNLMTYQKICSTNLLELENEARKQNGDISKNCPACHQGNEIEISKDETPVFNTSLRRLRVFLCHSSEDKLDVRKLYRHLRVNNVAPWLDEEDRLPGQNWEQEIRKAVRDADIVIVCLSRDSINKTGFVQKEIKFALDVADEQPEGTIFLIPLKLGECVLPERLRHLYSVNYFEEGGFDKLLRALKHRSESSGVKLAPVGQYRFKPGDEVSHDKFGKGIILKSEMVQNTQFVDVQFQSINDKKRLSLDYARHSPNKSSAFMTYFRWLFFYLYVILPNFLENMPQ